MTTLTESDWPEGFTFDPADERHGTMNGYGNLKCRCGDCRIENTTKRAERRKEMRGSLAPGDYRHGTNNGYTNYGCTCSDCRAAHAEANYRSPS